MPRLSDCGRRDGVPPRRRRLAVTVDRVDVRGGDIVLVHRVELELYYARVERAGPRDVVVQPLDPRTSTAASG